MFKNSVLIILVALSGNAIYASLDNQSTPLNVNQQNKTSKNNRYSVGSIILINTVAVAVAYMGVSTIASSLPIENQKQIMEHVTAVAFITTTGCVIVEGMNCIEHCMEHICNPPKQNDPGLKKSLELNQNK